MPRQTAVKIWPSPDEMPRKYPLKSCLTSQYIRAKLIQGPRWTRDSCLALPPPLSRTGDLLDSLDESSAGVGLTSGCVLVHASDCMYKSIRLSMSMPGSRAMTPPTLMSLKVFCKLVRLIGLLSQT